MNGGRTEEGGRDAMKQAKPSSVSREPWNTAIGHAICDSGYIGIERP
jgi:hypothetical protein